MAYPPPPYADAVCGGFVAGEAIVGTWWAYPSEPGLLLGGQNPQVTIIAGEQVSPAGIALGAFLPLDVGQHEVPVAGILLGGVSPSVLIVVVADAPQAGLLLGAVAPSLKLSQTLAAPVAGLLLGTYPAIFVGWMFLLPSECEDVELVGSSCVDVELEPAGCL